MFLRIILSFLFVYTVHMHAELQVEKEQSRKIALIFGASGQDGSYLTELLLSKNYEVHGVSRNYSNDNRMKGLISHKGNICNSGDVIKLVQSIQPDEIYNLAAQSSVHASFESPLETAEINALGVLNILEAIKLQQPIKRIKFFQAASSELFELGNDGSDQEKMLVHPRSPYAVSKLYSYWITINYREAYNIFGCNGILFNHESPRRPESFVSRKITLAASRYKLGLQDVLYLGNLNAKRDWGYAKDYVEAMWLMLQQDQPGDYVIATGIQHSVKECVEIAYKEIGVDIEWHGEGVEEYGIDASNGRIIVKVDPKFYRPCEGKSSMSCCIQAQKMLNWRPSTSFEELIKMMIHSDYENERARL